MIADLWNLNTNTGEMGATVLSVDAFEEIDPLTVIATISGTRYLYNPSWPCDADGVKLAPERLTLDGYTLIERAALTGYTDPSPDDL